jgi:hypothetical protein
MDELTVASAVPTSKRFRFGLRAIFTLMLVIAVGICFYKLGYRRGVESMKLSSALYVQTYDVHDLVTPRTHEEISELINRVRLAKGQ